MGTLKIFDERKVKEYENDDEVVKAFVDNRMEVNCTCEHPYTSYRLNPWKEGEDKDYRVVIKDPNSLFVKHQGINHGPSFFPLECYND